MLIGKLLVKISVKQNLPWKSLLVTCFFVACGFSVVYGFVNYSYELGHWSLFSRFILRTAGLLALLFAALPWLLLRKKSSQTTLLLSGFALLVLVVIMMSYSLTYQSEGSPDAILFTQSDGELITDSSSNGIIEVGFSYPIFTPNIALQNISSFSRDFDVYFRLVDSAGETWLYRGVRRHSDGTALSVESSVRGLLSRNPAYVFLPLQLAPQSRIEGRVAFVITHLDEGNSFTTALAQSQSATLELRAVVATEKTSRQNNSQPLRQSSEILAVIDVKQQ